MNGNETKKKSHLDDELMHLDDVEVIDFEDIDLSEAIVIAGFPSIGLVSTIVANYLIDALTLKQIGSVKSSQFPALSVVHTMEPLSPVRIYFSHITVQTFVVDIKRIHQHIIPFADPTYPCQHLIIFRR